MKGVRLSFLLPRCRLSYLKIVQTESNAKFAKIRIANLKPIYFIFITEVQPILFKDSAKILLVCCLARWNFTYIYKVKPLHLLKDDMKFG